MFDHCHYFDIYFNTPFNSVNVSLKDAGKNSPRFVVDGAWLGYPSFSALVGFEPVLTPAERVERYSAMYTMCFCTSVLKYPCKTSVG